MSKFFLIIIVFLILAQLPVAVQAQPQLPNSLAATGDSLSQGFGAGPRYFGDNTAYAWATGGHPSVNSVALRLATRNPALAGNVYNLARVGARMADLPTQLSIASALEVEYVTVMMGGNDACASSEAAMTPVATFRTQFATALTQLGEQSPQTSLLVMSIPDPTRLLPLFRNDRRALLVWETFAICPSALAAPRSEAPEDVARRERVRQRVAEYNAVLGEVCASTPRCRYDNGVVFASELTAADVSPVDYFHLSARGQARLAETAWRASGFE
ncbi:GDSL-type esterase/lipase family protein [Candidatus Chloroploca asiatica]|uniref:SGNH hydrolase-type esterase domain-containing protein n=1 Tax=Candidatus Chloroploca asiatica TaxID=1506545 RepID=A0A2H3KGP4_9CHLR|nr:GDSL-type esterase/lipase family protein [Candidatus Chloroploca asiatica]PDV96925.1 hypothetical protein A9Q02_19780 [Candidatus Chloroploca asiatica]